ncbi:MAG: MotA/TolQ/ExbB proton channel family protein [Cytophagales bacterium]
MSLAFILLQATGITEVGEAASAATSTSAHQSIPVFSLILKGGFVMLPIFILLVITLYVFFQKYLMINNAGKLPENFISKLNQLILNGQVSEAKIHVGNAETPIAKVLAKGVSRLGKPIKDIEASMENTAKIEIGKLEKNVGILGIVSGIAPMFGFIGTIIGVISIFYDISLQGEISIGGVADGLYQKMVTSASGLVVGIISHLGHHIINLKLDSVIRKIEVTSIEFIDLLQENK